MGEEGHSKQNECKGCVSAGTQVGFLLHSATGSGPPSLSVLGLSWHVEGVSTRSSNWNQAMSSFLRDQASLKSWADSVMS